MSIWCSWPGVGHDDWEDGPLPIGGEVRTYAEGFGNHHPDLTGSHELPAVVDIAHSAPWCTPGHDECGDCDEHVGPWVRLTLSAPRSLSWWTKPGEEKPTVEPLSASVVMDEDAARRLAADLLEWADSPKVHPQTHKEAAQSDAGSEVGSESTDDTTGPQIGSNDHEESRP